MSASDYIKNLRAHVGHATLMIPSVTGIIYDAERTRVLLVRHVEANVWVAPGGAMEPNERPADAVAREVWEETGLHVEPVSVRGVYAGPEFLIAYANGDQVTYVMTVFECRVLSGEPKPDGHETLEIRYVSHGQLDELPLSNWARVVLPAMFETDTATRFQPSTWEPRSSTPGSPPGSGGFRPDL